MKRKAAGGIETLRAIPWVFAINAEASPLGSGDGNQTNQDITTGVVERFQRECCLFVEIGQIE